MHEHRSCECGCGSTREGHERHRHDSHHEHDHCHDHHHGGGHSGCGCRGDTVCRADREQGGEETRRGEPCPDTRFLQLEMAQVLFAEAEGVTKDALRALLLEAAKARLQQRFGSKIIGLAELAADELMADILASLNVEARIRHRQREGGRLRERLSDIFGEGSSAGECGSGRNAPRGGGEDAPHRGDDDESGGSSEDR